jgi:hypothetical protein
LHVVVVEKNHLMSTLEEKKGRIAQLEHAVEEQKKKSMQLVGDIKESNNHGEEQAAMVSRSLRVQFGHCTPFAHTVCTHRLHTVCTHRLHTPFAHTVCTHRLHTPCLTILLMVVLSPLYLVLFFRHKP